MPAIVVLAAVCVCVYVCVRVCLSVPCRALPVPVSVSACLSYRQTEQPRYSVSWKNEEGRECVRACVRAREKCHIIHPICPSDAAFLRLVPFFLLIG